MEAVEDRLLALNGLTILEFDLDGSRHFGTDATTKGVIGAGRHLLHQVLDVTPIDPLLSELCWPYLAVQQRDREQIHEVVICLLLDPAFLLRTVGAPSKYIVGTLGYLYMDVLDGFGVNLVLGT